MRRVFVADEHSLVCRGIAAVLEPLRDVEVCGDAHSADAIRSGVENLRPHLVTLELRLQDGDGLELIRHLCNAHPALSVLVVSGEDEALYAPRALRAGARGFVSKCQGPDVLVKAVKKLLDGGSHLGAELEAHLADRYVRGLTLSVDTPIANLSDRELQVYRMIGAGETTNEIAAALCLSVKTIESHRTGIKRKLDIRTTAQLVHRATRTFGMQVSADPADIRETLTCVSGQAPVTRRCARS